MKSGALVAISMVSLLSVACSNSDAPKPGVDTTVTAFDSTPVYFTGSDNERVVYAPVTFPTDGTYSKITLHLALTCPSEGCDPWDRFGSLGLVTTKGDTSDDDVVVEIQRFITPFGVGAGAGSGSDLWDLDVTDLRPLLSGSATLRGFIDTWVGPGSEYGGGWLLSASFTMTGGVPDKIPTAVVPVWTQRDLVYGDSTQPIGSAGAAPPMPLTLPSGSSYTLRSFVTGHGQANLDNCAEFCSKTHTFTVGSTPHAQAVWRDDCGSTVTDGPQQGTYEYSRSGWCPGAYVDPLEFDVTPDLAGQTTASISYDVEAYDNTCDGATCTGCAAGTSCAYDGSTHTEPNFWLSSSVIVYQ